MATDSLNGAICQAFAAASTLTAIFATDGLPGCWTGEAPEDKQLPFVIVNVIGGDTQWDSGGFGVETSAVEFEVFAETASATDDGAMALMRVFDVQPSPIVLNTYFMMSFLRTSPRVPQVQELRNADGEIVYAAKIGYNALVQIAR